MKGVVEQSILAKKVRNAKDEAQEVYNKRSAAFLKGQNASLS